MRKALLAAIAVTSVLAAAAWAQETSPVAAPKGSWALTTTIQPYPHVWGVYPSSDACMAGQKQLHLQAINRLSSMRGVTPDQFSDAVNKLKSLDAANCVQS